MKVYYIYKIINLINDKVYIGQTCQPRSRWSRHKSDARRNKKNHICNAIRKYGEANFKFQILFETTYSKVDKMEINTIELYNSSNRKFGYNKSLGGQTVRLVSAETRLKLSKASKRRKVRKGFHHSDETKKLLSDALKGNKNRLGFKVTQKTKNKLSKIRCGQKDSEETKIKKSKSMIGKNAGVKNGMFGRRGSLAKLTYQDALKIRDEYKLIKISMLKLAAKYNVSKKTILNIIHNRIYVK